MTRICIPLTLIQELCDERERQDAQWGGPIHDDQHSAAEWVALATRQLGLAVDDGTGQGQERFRRQMLRVAALCMAAIESYDRTHPPATKVVGDFQAGSGF